MVYIRRSTPITLSNSSYNDQDTQTNPNRASQYKHLTYLPKKVFLQTVNF